MTHLPAPALRLADVPEISGKQWAALRRRNVIGRRSFGKRAAAGAVGLGLAYLGTVSRATNAGAGFDGNYWVEYQNPGDGPCHPVTGYARNHTEEGKKCGPSVVCANNACCHQQAGTQPPAPGGNKAANVNNANGWHRHTAAGTNPRYRQRPDECFGNATGSNYDSWRWNKDGVTWGCSDGKTITNGQTVNTICAWNANAR